MQQRYAFAIMVTLTRVTAPGGNEVDELFGSVQAADADDVTHFTSLRQLGKWIEALLPPHVSPSGIPTTGESPQ